MARVAGIQVEKDTKGRVSYVRIDVKKYPEFIPQLEKLGAIDYDDFEKRWNNPTNMTIEEARKRTFSFIESLPWKE